MDRWFVVKINGRVEGPLRVKAKDPNMALRAGNAWIDQQFAGGDDGTSAYRITNVYLDQNQADHAEVKK